jgi:hypothetical protein
MHGRPIIMSVTTECTIRSRTAIVIVARMNG